jgi:hypothetical protein
MTNIFNEELGLNVVACQHWRWMPGMKIYLEDTPSIGTLRVIAAGRRGVPITRNGSGQMTTWSTATIPDLTDAATLGCLLALVRQALDDRRIHCRARANKFRVYSGVTPIGDWTFSEADALVTALEASEFTNTEDETA